MNRDVWEILKSYTNILVNLMINISIKLFLMYKWFPPPKNSLTKVYFNLITLSLTEIQVQKNRLVNFLI